MASDSDLCRCGHARCFHDVGTGNGVPLGKPYCSDLYGDDAAYNCKCTGFVRDDSAWERAYAASKTPAKKSIYLIGSLRNPRVPEVAKQLREAGFEVFDDWYAAGPEADDKWRDYEVARGHGFIEALGGYACKHVFEFDKSHLDRCDMAVLLLPAGKSCHLELGYKIGTGKPGYIILDQDPERFDAMYRFAFENRGNVFHDVDEFLLAMVR